MKEQLYTLPSDLRTQETEKPFMLPTPRVPTMTEGMVRALQTEYFNNFDNYFNVVKGLIKSGNFITGVSGWQIDAAGNAEFNNGVFRGTFSIGGTIKTVNTIADVYTSLIEVEAAGGGIVYLLDGTYVLTADINIPAGVVLEGVTRDGVIIDCDSSYSVNINGTNAYSTGTVSINDGDTTVVGSGTTWTAAMVGRYILLNDFYYEITARTDNTHLTIGDPYAGTNLSGASYVLADVNFNGSLKKVTVTNATGAGVEVQYAVEPNLGDIVVYDCGTGIDIDYTVFPNVFVTSEENGVNFDANRMYGFKIDFCVFDGSTSGAGVVLNNCTGTFFDSQANFNTTNNLSVTGASNIAFISANFNGAGAKGIELISGNSDIQFIAVKADSNTSDGLKLTATSDKIKIIGSTFTSNGGYGVNVAASTCDDNIIEGNTFSGNSTAAINDSGTGTIIRGNSGVNDNGHRITRRVVTVTQSATPAINTDITDVASITGLAQAITSLTTNLTGTPVAGDLLMIQITDDGTARGITWGASFASTTIALPTTTVISTMLRVGFQWNTATSKWDCVAVA